jgi:hypothetical protein
MDIVDNCSSTIRIIMIIRLIFPFLLLLDTQNNEGNQQLIKEGGDKITRFFSFIHRYGKWNKDQNRQNSGK